MSTANIKPQNLLINWGNPITQGLVFDSGLAEGRGINSRDSVTGSLGVLTNTPTWGVHQKGIDMTFTDASSQVVLYTTKAGQNTLAQITTESLIIPTVDNANDKRFVHKGPDAKYFAFAYTNHIFEFSSSWSVTEGDWDTTTNYTTLNVPYHVVATYSYSAVGNTPAMYVNGLLQTISNISVAVGSAPTDTTDLGVGNRPVTKSKAFAGSVVYSRYWNRMLNHTEVKSLYNNPFQIYV